MEIYCQVKSKHFILHTAFYVQQWQTRPWKVKNNPSLKVSLQLLGSRGVEETLFARPPVGQRSGSHTEFHLLSWYWGDFFVLLIQPHTIALHLQYVLQENGHLINNSRTVYILLYFRSKERHHRRCEGNSGMSRKEVSGRVHLMNLLREAEGWSKRCVKSNLCVKCVCVCVCLMLQSCKAAAGEGRPLRTTAAG